MTIRVEKVTVENFHRHALVFENRNFLQSSEMMQNQLKRPNFFKTEALVFIEDNQRIGQCIVNYTKTKKIFTEAHIFQGPLLDFENGDRVKKVLQALDEYFKKQKVSKVTVSPYLVNQSYDETLQHQTPERYLPLKKVFAENGYVHWLDKTSTAYTVSQVFRKNLKQYESVESMYQQLEAPLKRNLKKTIESFVFVKEEQEGLDIFYKLWNETSERKQFKAQSKLYFELLKHYFQGQAKFMVAYLDLVKYKNYLDEQMTQLKEKIKELEATNQVKKRGQLNDAKNQLARYEKRVLEYDHMPKDSEHFVLSAYTYICYGDEVVSLAGGTSEAYFHFGGATLINWEMIKFAFENGYHYYNFYGTIETDQATQNSGNFNFKRQFGGTLDVLIGSFTKYYSPVLKWLSKRG